MTNREKFKTSKEMVAYYLGQAKAICELTSMYRFAACFAIEPVDYEKPLPCPFCGRELDVSRAANTKSYGIHCDCGYYAPWKRTKRDAIATHNRVAKAAKESGAAK